MFEAHRPRVANGEAGGVQKVNLKVQERLEKIRNAVHRIRMVAVEGDDQVPGGVGKSFLVRPPVTSHVLADYRGPQPLRYDGCAISRAVIDHNDLVHIFGHASEDLLDALLLVQAWNDHRDAMVFVHAAMRDPQRRGSRRAGDILLSMKTLIVLILGVCLGASAAEAPAGLDQCLAEPLASQGPFAVVVEPRQAEAVFSERVDPALAESLNLIYAPLNPPEKPKKDANTPQSDPPPRRAPASARGNMFLIDVASRQVIWSTYLKLEDRSPHGLHRAAQDIVKRLKKDLSGKD